MALKLGPATSQVWSEYFEEVKMNGRQCERYQEIGRSFKLNWLKGHGALDFMAVNFGLPGERKYGRWPMWILAASELWYEPD